MKKYKLTEESIEIDNTKLFRIIALIDIPMYNIKAGDLGGFIEKEANLSQEGNAWVCEDAKVSGNARVYENAWVFGNAQVYGNAGVFGNARVYENAWVFGNAQVYGNARVFENARVFGNAWVSETARVFGNAQVYGNAKVSGKAIIKFNVFNTKDYICIGPLGSNRYITYNKNDKKIAAGCFYDTIENFEMAVKAKYSDDSDYYLFINVLKSI